MRAAWLLMLALLLPGCLGGDAPGGGATEPLSRAPLEAPWWNLGESWTVEIAQAGKAPYTTTLVNFANDSFGDPPHFWLGVADRDKAMEHVFFDNNPLLGRIHWEILSPHEKGMHAGMYSWPLEDGARWDTNRLFGTEGVGVRASANADGTFAIEGSNTAGARLTYDYDPATRWFRHFEVTQDGTKTLVLTVKDHKESGAKGTFYFLRGRDYLDSEGGRTGTSEPFKVKDEGASSIAFLLDITTRGPSALEFVAPDGEVWHRETLPTGGASDKIVEVKRAPPAGDWRLRYVGDVSGEVKVRGVIEYKATL